MAELVRASPLDLGSRTGSETWPTSRIATAGVFSRGF